VSAWGELLVGLVVLAGLVGVILPVLPGSALVLAAIGVWAWIEGTTGAWAVFAGGALLIGAATIVKYAWPGRRLRASGIPTATLAVGIAVGIVGFFVIPVVGLPLGFVLGIYLGALRRLGSAPKARARDGGRCACRRAVDPRRAGGRDGRRGAVARGGHRFLTCATGVGGRQCAPTASSTEILARGMVSATAAPTSAATAHTPNSVRYPPSDGSSVPPSLIT
jgi:uncharacterized protein YqgC (DUF456 family)